MMHSAKGRRFLLLSVKMTAPLLWVVFACLHQGCASHPYPPERTYHDNGRKMEIIRRDKNGKKHGKCQTWYSSGMKKSVIVYKHGETKSYTFWNPNGKKAIAERYRE